MVLALTRLHTAYRIPRRVHNPYDLEDLQLLPPGSLLQITITANLIPRTFHKLPSEHSQTY